MVVFVMIIYIYLNSSFFYLFVSKNHKIFFLLFITNKSNRRKKSPQHYTIYNLYSIFNPQLYTRKIKIY